MSVFLVSARTINQMVAGIRWFVNHQHRPELVNALAAIEIDPAKAHWEEQLANALFALNARAVAHRYNEPVATGFTYRRVSPPANPYQLWKSLDCWLYQCTEGNVTTSHLYHVVTELVVPLVLRHIVERSPAYDQAEWG